MNESLNIVNNHKINLGVRAGIDIGDLDNRGFTPHFISSDMLNSNDIFIKSKKESPYMDTKQNNERSSSEILAFHTSLFDSRPTLTDNPESTIYGYERKIAANQYNKSTKNFVTDINEFVSDALNI